MPPAPHWGIPGRVYTQLASALKLVSEELSDHWASDTLVYLLTTAHCGIIQGSLKAINLSGRWTEALGNLSLACGLEDMPVQRWREGSPQAFLVALGSPSEELSQGT